MCLLWRCRFCGASRVGTINQKPPRCDTCGATDFEFVEED